MRLDPVLVTILTAVIAAIAGMLGYWLNSRLTTRREQWAFRRDLYVRLLEHLHEASVVLDGMVRTRSTEHAPILTREVEQVRRARAVAALFLHHETSQAIDQLNATWTSLRTVQGQDDDVLRQRIGALRVAYDAVLKAGRKDLALGKARA